VHSVTASGDDVSKPERTRNFLIVFTAAFTFIAGVLAAHDQVALGIVMLVLVAAGWLAAAIVHA
jgi:hypothetical protein